MKTFVFVAMFALVAIQLSQSAPTPDEDKKAEVAATPIAVATDIAEKAADPVAEVKTDVASASEAVAKSPEGIAAAEEKKA